MAAWACPLREHPVKRDTLCALEQTNQARRGRKAGEQLTAMRVYKYGIRGDLPPEAIEEIRRAHRLRNQLVEIERRHSDRVAAVWATRPELAEADDAVEKAETIVDELVEEGKKTRSRNATTDIGVALRAQLKEARAKLREVKKARKELRAEAYATLKPLHAEAATERNAEVKATYGPSVAEGLYWATYNDVKAHHETARQAVRSKRAEGKPADLRFHRWDGSGTLTVQLQRQADDPPRTPLTLAGESKWRNALQIMPALDPTPWSEMTRSDQRKLSRTGVLRFRIGSGEASTVLELPILLHRPIPPDADVTLVRLTRRMLAGKPHVSASVVVRLPDVPERTEGPVVAAHLGWRSRGDGSLRVAVIAGAPKIPENLQHIVRQHDHWAEVILPPGWRSTWDKTSQIRSQRDRNQDVLRKWVLAWLEEHPVTWPEDFDLTHIAKWRAPGRWATMALRLRKLDDGTYPIEGTEELANYLEDWRRQDKHLWSWSANGHDKVLGRRQDAYRCIAAWLCSEAAVVALDEWSVASMARTPGLEEIDEEWQRKARANLVQAAPASLRAAIANAASARGVIVVPGQTVAEHVTCGRKLNPEERRSEIHVWCPTCETMVDQDHNSLQQLLAYAQGYQAGQDLQEE